MGVMDRLLPRQEWEDDLQTDSVGRPLSTVENACIILSNDRLLKDHICRSAFDGRRWVVGRIPWNIHGPRAGDHLWSEWDEAGLRWYLEEQWGLRGKAAITDALELVAREQTFHPVRQYLKGLQWDGTRRLDTMLVDYLGAEDTPYVRAVTRKWMAAGCRRVFEPGCKFDTMLVLVSPRQGLGKSMLGDILAGEWFKDGLRDIDTKDALQELQGKWIVEVAELSALKKAGVEQLKQFLSCRKDTFRPAYSRYAVDHPRQCIFLGSTNEGEFILDETGGRRFWPVEVQCAPEDTPYRTAALRENRDQLWAEAMERWREGEPLYFSDPRDLRAAEEMQQRFAKRDDLQGLVQAYLERLLPADWEDWPAERRRAFILKGGAGTLRRQKISIAEIRYELLGENVMAAERNNASSRRLGKVMNVMPGWRKDMVRNTVLGKQMVYVRTNETNEISI